MAKVYPVFHVSQLKLANNIGPGGSDYRAGFYSRAPHGSFWQCSDISHTDQVAGLGLGTRDLGGL
jgi:hypothetical protein